MAQQQTMARVVHEWTTPANRCQEIRYRMVANVETGARLLLVVEEHAGVDALGVDQWRRVAEVRPHGDAMRDVADDDPLRVDPLARVLLLALYKLKMKVEHDADRLKRVDEELAELRRRSAS